VVAAAAAEGGEVTTNLKWRVVASCPRKRHPIGTVYVRAETKALAIAIGKRGLSQIGVKKLTCVSAHPWSPETDREFLASGWVGPVKEESTT